MKRLALLVFTLVGCVHTVAPGSSSGEAIAAVRGAWRAQGLPSAGDCATFDVRVHNSKRAFLERCDGVSPGMSSAAERGAVGCTTSSLQGLLGKRVWTIEVAPEAATDLALVQHEAIHVFVYCALTRPSADPFDAGHTDPRLWTAASKDPATRNNSVQSRARQVSHQGVLGGP